MNEKPLQLFIDALMDNSPVITFDPQVVIYWKRMYEYKSENRCLDMQEIDYVVHGCISGEVNGDHVNIESGDLIWINARTPHSLVWQNDMIYYTLRFKFMHNNEDITIKDPYLHITDVNKLEYLFRNIAFIVRIHEKIGNYHLQLNAFFMLLMIGLQNIIGEFGIKKQKRELDEYEKNKIYNYCISNAFAGITAKDLCRQLCFCRDYFSRLFKNSYGKSLRTWIVNERMKFAATQLIDSEISINELSNVLGYDDIYVFSRQFKKVFGLFPAKYRQDNKKLIITNEETVLGIQQR